VASWYSHGGNALRWLYGQRIENPPILEPARYFPNAARFIAAYPALQEEALRIAGMLDRLPRFHDIMKKQTEISANDGRDWRMFVMKAYGAEIRGNLDRAPAMRAVLSGCPEVLSATYSFLAPGKHVPCHRGPFRGVLRFHLGLSMPRNARGELGAILWVDGEPHRLDNGDTLLWDDTYPHEVLNATDSVRIALILDVWRPDMPADMAALSSVIVKTMGTICTFNPQAFAG
jgi:aspartate beta-hydroxylase